MSTSAPSTLDAAELQASFETFSRISRSLEDAYERLRHQAAAVDVALAEANHRLQEKVDELDRTTGHLEAVLESLGSGVVATDERGTITRVNGAFAEWMGRPSTALVGHQAEELRDDRDTAVLSPTAEGEIRRLQTARGIRSVRIDRSAIRGQEGERLGTLWSLSDETETEELRARLQEQETFAALGEMAGGVAHELRNPMSAVEGFATLLDRQLSAEAESSRKHTRRIVRGIRKANSIIEHLLCFAQPERFRPHRTPLAKVVDQAIAELSPGPAPHWSPPEGEVLAYCDPALIERVVVNLVENARQASGRDAEVELHVEGDGVDAFLCVRDDGPGIPEALRDRLFRPFVTGRADGVGLGLALVRRIVDLHAGEVQILPRSPRGTEIRVRLPRQAPPPTTKECR